MAKEQPLPKPKFPREHYESDPDLSDGDDVLENYSDEYNKAQEEWVKALKKDGGKEKVE